MHLVPMSELPAEEASGLAWQLLNERPTYANISHRQMPARADHDRFVANPPYKDWYAISDGGKLVGTVYLTRLNEIGIAVLQEFQRNGYARAAIIEVMKGGGEFLANVAPKNIESQALFEGLGGRIIQYTYRLT